VMFSIPYGGEVTQIPLVIERYFGTRSMATLVGISLFVTGIGGALGPWTAGKLYDITGSYQWAFVAAIAGGIGSIIVIWLLKNKDRTK